MRDLKTTSIAIIIPDFDYGGEEHRAVFFANNYLNYFDKVYLIAPDGESVAKLQPEVIHVKTNVRDIENICSRPSCYQCHFKTLNRVSDITIFDCWDAPSVSKIFTNKGATNVFIHTGKGVDVFEELKADFIWSVADINPIIKRDGLMIKNRVPMNPKRGDFFRDLNRLSIKDVEKKYLPSSIVREIIVFVKPLLYKIGVFNLYMKIKAL